MNLDRSNLEQILRQLADEVLALRWPGTREDERVLPWLVGIRTGGEAVARELAAVLALTEGVKPEVGTIDCSLYRDDTWLRGPRLIEGQTSLPGDPTGQRILLVDDVLASGRTVRAALAVLADLGRPRAVALAVLLDRGGRELPIQPDAVGLRLQVEPTQSLRLQCDSHGRMERVVTQNR